MPAILYQLDDIDEGTRSVKLTAYSGNPVRSYRIDWSTFEIIEVDEVIDSWDLARFTDNPVMLWAHEYGQLPIGKAEEIEANGGELKMRLVFNSRLANPFADQVWENYRLGFLKTFSVGFQRGEERMEEGAERPLIHLLGNELLEVSAVPVPRDRRALVETDSAKRLFDFRALKRMYTSLNADGSLNKTGDDYEDDDTRGKKRLSDAGRTLANARRSKQMLSHDSVQARVDAADAEEMVFRLDFFGRLGTCERLDSGAVRVPATLGRTGVLRYRQPDGSIRRELRLPEEVFSERSISSLRGSPVTERHSGGMVTPEVWKQVSIGHTEVSERQDGQEAVSGALVISDAKAIEKCDAGELRDISPGYFCRLEFTPGEWNGEHYDAIQRDIVHNHITLMPPGGGRQGSEVGLRLDAMDAVCVLESQPVEETPIPKEDAMATPDTKTITKIRLDGQDYVQGSDEHIAKLDSIRESEVSTLQAKLDAAEAQAKADVDKVKAEKDALQAKLDAADKEKAELQAKLDAASSTEAIDKRVEERLAFEAKARVVFGDDQTVKLDGKDVDRLRGKSEQDIMIDVIKHADPKFDAADKSPAYLQAMFDIVTSKASEESREHREDGLPGVVKKAEELKQKLDESDKEKPAGLPQRWKEPLAASKDAN